MGDLWIFLDYHLNPNNYPEQKYYEDIRKYELHFVSQLDKGFWICLNMLILINIDEIIKYFTGEIEDSDAINQELRFVYNFIIWRLV